MAIPDGDVDYLRRMAHEAAHGILGYPPPPESELSDSIFTSLCRVVDDAHERGLRATLVQLSLVPDGAHAVG